MRLFLLLFICAQTAVAAPRLNVDWSGRSHSAVTIRASTRDSAVEQCLQGGLELRYRFEVQLCEERKLWFDQCGEMRVFVRNLSHEPVSGSYRLRSDLHRDLEEPQVLTTESLREAVAIVAQLRDLPLSELDNPLHRDRGSLLLKARVSTDCKGDYNRTLSRLSYFLTMGLLKSGVSDSGWKTFNLSAEVQSQEKVKPE
jgi:Domain of unknown function (DUF4390)